jgi:regulator of RNase E activity RraA
MQEHKRHRGAAGRIADEKIGPEPKRATQEVIERFKSLADLAGTVSDALDELGIVGCVGASELRPTIPDRRIVGCAITVRNAPQRRDPHINVTENHNLMTEVEGINQADPGDVLVIEGLRHISNMGGIMATTAKRQGLAGAVVDGGVRDVGHSRSLGFPIWSRDISPVTGKWRIVTEEINVPVTIAGIKVHPGDLVVADETGVCFVPQDLIAEVLKRCEAADKKEEAWVSGLDKGMSIPELVKKIYGLK